ncbi:MAG: transcription antitermination factor NusB [Desulfobacterales bacterium]|nr:transcription antitermination factor NusB [Desulfobacterales bacterium]
MSNRHKSRELALQILFCMDMLGNNTDALFDDLGELISPKQAPSNFCRRLVKGVIEHRSDLDRIIEAHSSNWRVYRMSGVDRNILRLAAFEMLYCEDIPAKVSINEAIEIGKKFGTDETGPFVNGVLDAIRQHHGLDSSPGAAEAEIGTGTSNDQDQSA